MADINRYISCVFDEIRGELEEYYIFKEKIKIKLNNLVVVVLMLYFINTFLFFNFSTINYI